MSTHFILINCKHSLHPCYPDLLFCSSHLTASDLFFKLKLRKFHEKSIKTVSISSNPLFEITKVAKKVALMRIKRWSWKFWPKFLNFPRTYSNSSIVVSLVVLCPIFSIKCPIRSTRKIIFAKSNDMNYDKSLKNAFKSVFMFLKI